MRGVCQKGKEVLTWAGEGPGGLSGPQSHPVVGHSDPGQSMHQSALGRRVQKSPCRPLPLLGNHPWMPMANWHGGGGPDGRCLLCHP